MSQVLDEAELAWQKMQEAYIANGENGHGDVEPPEGNTRSPRYIQQKNLCNQAFYSLVHKQPFSILPNLLHLRVV